MTEHLANFGAATKRMRIAPTLASFAIVAAVLLRPAPLPAQDTPRVTIDEDCQAFDIARDNSIVYAVSHIKGVKRLVIEHDDIWVVSGAGKTRKIVEAEKFMPIPPPEGFRVDSLAWSPDSQRIAMNMTLQLPPPGWNDKNNKKKGDLDDSSDENLPPLAGIGGGRALALLDADGHEIRVAGSKTRFIEGALNGTWLADGVSVVYLTGGPPYAITRVRPSDGQSSVLFGGHTFNMVIWDAKRNRAFAVGNNLSLHGHLTLVQLDLLHETVTEISEIDNYQSSLSLSPSGTKIGYFEDGDTMNVIDLLHPTDKPLRVRTGFGRFGWSRDEKHVLLKRGPDDRSNILLWVGLYDGTFASILHDLQFHDFEIAPDGQTIAVTIPGKRVLKVYPLQ